MYSRPRCACLACSDLAPSDDFDGLYSHPTTTLWRHDDDDNGDVYYNSNDFDVDRPRHGCDYLGGTVPGQEGRPLLQGHPLTTSCMFQPHLAGKNCRILS